MTLLPDLCGPPLSISMELFLVLLSFTALFFPSSTSSENTKYDACSKRLQSCGSLGTDIGFPFYDGSTRPHYCGNFKLSCQGFPKMFISDQSYYVSSIDAEEYTVKLYREGNWTGNCPDSLASTNIDFYTYRFTSTYQNITFFYDCFQIDGLSSLSLKTSCNLGGNGSAKSGYYLTQKMVEDNSHLNLLRNCKSNLYIPILQSTAEAIDASPSLETLIGAFKEGFELGLASSTFVDPYQCDLCIQSGGECGYDHSREMNFVCHCADADHDYYDQCRVISPPGHNKKRMVLIIACFATAAGIVILGFLVFFNKIILQKCKPTPKDHSVEDWLKNYASSVPRRYTYANVKKMTNSFKQKLGEGGYGEVYKGILHDGRVVAVKVCKQSKGDGQDFANEVLSISRTRHVNIVPLLGFCFEGNKRALMYEFMPNGSLEKFLNNRDSSEYTLSFATRKLHEIAKGIAKGLEYLHRDCDTRIVHFDIKPHNILLNAEFIPKISDFGLAKPLKKKESIISMSEARGTIGYIAPEVFFRSYGGVSHKSDVYSYGMMVLEMVGCTKSPTEGNSENNSEMYFPQWVYKKLEQEPDSDKILNSADELKRKMILVGLWCIQINPSNRPSMSRVVEMLEGDVELLQLAPIPFLFPPTIVQQPTEDGSATLLTSSSPYSYVITSP